MQWFAGVAIIVSMVVGIQGRTVSWAQNTAPVSVVPQQATDTPDTQPGDTPDTYRYSVEGRRDPFESLVKEKIVVVEPGPIIEPTRPRGPLERFDLSALTLSGIIWGELGRRAIIKAPDGKGYFVTIGMYMGQNGGQIVAIEDDQLIIKEKHRDIKGTIVDKTLTIPLRRKDNRQG